jgi:dipeptidyl aminopeptidase/acylaminoacyl peptidase
MLSDVNPGGGPRLVPTADGRSVLFTAPIDGSYELWRIGLADGRLERLTEDRHYISGWDAVPGPRGASRIAYLRSTATETADVWLLDGSKAPRRLSAFNADVLAELELVRRESDTSPSTGGTSRAGSCRPAGRAAAGRPSTAARTRSTAGPLLGVQVLAANGSASSAGPRGSEGYGGSVQRRQPPRLGAGTDPRRARGRRRPTSPTAWPTPTGSGSRAARTAAT